MLDSSTNSNNSLNATSLNSNSSTANAYGLASTSSSTSSFTSNLPSGYKAFGGVLIRADNFYVPDKGGITGAPLPTLPPDNQVAFGNPNTRYAWVGATSDPFLYKPNSHADQPIPLDLPPTFHLDGDDALVLTGKTPPLPNTYFSFTLYDSLTKIYATPNPELAVDGYTYTATSIGLSTNQQNIKTAKSSSSPSDSFFALIVTSNTTTRNKVQDALVKSGIPLSAINSYLVPKTFTNAGATNKPEQLSFLARYTFQTADEKNTNNQYMNGFTSISPALEFSKLKDKIQSYGDKQDNKDNVSTISFTDGGQTLALKGDAWKKLEFSKNITPNTVVQFDFKSNAKGNIQGIGFDNDNVISYDKFFQLYGTQSVGISNFNNYGSPASDWKTYKIPVGQFFTGQSKYLTFINDTDSTNAQADSMFNNVVFYENVPDPIVKAAFVQGPGKDGNITDVPIWEDTLKTNSTIPISDLSQRLNQLQTNVISSYTKQGYSVNQVLTEELRHSDPNFNRANNSYGAYDAPDAIYSYFSDGSIDSPSLGSVFALKSTDDLLVMIGADSTTIGDNNAATYWSYQSKPYAGPAETFAFTGVFTQGSGATYLSSDKAQDLFAVNIKPSNQFGAGQPYTVNVPYKDAASLTSSSFGIVGRLYLDKLTGSAPNIANLIPARIIWLTKSNPSQKNSSSISSTSTTPQNSSSISSINTQQNLSNSLVLQNVNEKIHYGSVFVKKTNPLLLNEIKVSLNKSKLPINPKQKANDLLVMIGADSTTISDGDAATYRSYQLKPDKGLTYTFAFTQGSGEKYISLDLAPNSFAVDIKPSKVSIKPSKVSINIKPSNKLGEGQPYTVNIPYRDAESLAKSFGMLGNAYLDILQKI